jgi:hypothetical protein
VVVASRASYNATDPSWIGVRNVRSSSFEVSVDASAADSLQSLAVRFNIVSVDQAWSRASHDRIQTARIDQAFGEWGKDEIFGSTF